MKGKVMFAASIVFMVGIAVGATAEAIEPLGNNNKLLIVAILAFLTLAVTMAAFMVVKTGEIGSGRTIVKPNIIGDNKGKAFLLANRSNKHALSLIKKLSGYKRGGEIIPVSAEEYAALGTDITVIYVPFRKLECMEGLSQNN
jgi:hypothetical protein